MTDDGKYRVWREGYHSEANAETLEAWDAETAALIFAEDDCSKCADGEYHNVSEVVCVRDWNGDLTRFDVSAQMKPEFYADEIDTTTEAP